MSVDVRWRGGDDDGAPPIRKVVIELSRTIDRSDRPSTLPDVLTPPSLSPVHTRTLKPRSPLPTPADSSPSSDGSERESYFGLTSQSTQSSDTSESSSPELARLGWKRDSSVVMSMARDGGELVPSGDRTWSMTIEGAVPSGRSAYHYSLGQTCTTADLRVRAYLSGRVRPLITIALTMQIILRNKTVVELAPIEVEIRPISVEERKAAQLKIGKIIAAHAAEARVFGSSASASPTRRAASREPSTDRKLRLDIPGRRESADALLAAGAPMPSGLPAGADSDDDDAMDAPPMREISGPPSFMTFSLQPPSPLPIKPGHVRRTSSGVGPSERARHPPPPSRSAPTSPPESPKRALADETRRKSSSGLRFLGEALRLGSRHSVSH